MDAHEIVVHEVDRNRSLYLGMSIPEAAKKLLGSQRRAMGNAEISAALQAGGLIMKSADPVNTIGAVMTRRFIRLAISSRSVVGSGELKEWYPNRSFKPKGATENGSKSDSSEPAPPRGQMLDELLS